MRACTGGGLSSARSSHPPRMAMICVPRSPLRGYRTSSAQRFSPCVTHFRPLWLLTGAAAPQPHPSHAISLPKSRRTFSTEPISSKRTASAESSQSKATGPNVEDVAAIGSRLLGDVPAMATLISQWSIGSIAYRFETMQRPRAKPQWLIDLEDKEKLDAWERAEDRKSAIRALISSVGVAVVIYGVWKFGLGH